MESRQVLERILSPHVWINLRIAILAGNPVVVNVELIIHQDCPTQPFFFYELLLHLKLATKSDLEINKKL